MCKNGRFFQYMKVHLKYIMNYLCHYWGKNGWKNTIFGNNELSTKREKTFNILKSENYKLELVFSCENDIC